jgi:hypothetical protein
MNPASSILQRTKTGLKPPFRTSIRNSSFLHPAFPHIPSPLHAQGQLDKPPLKSNFLAVSLKQF